MEIEKEEKNMVEISREAHELTLQATKKNECKFEEEILNMGLKKEFMRKNNVEAGMGKRKDQDFNIKYA